MNNGEKSHIDHASSQRTPQESFLLNGSMNEKDLCNYQDAVLADLKQNMTSYAPEDTAKAWAIFH